MDLRSAAWRKLGALRDPASVTAQTIKRNQKALRLMSQRLLFMCGTDT
jgi:hypothetical protein